MNFLKVSHWVHIALSALMWSLVGVKMNLLAANWLSDFQNDVKIYILIIGVIVGISVALFLFSKLVRKNILRINKLPKKSNIIYFQSLKSYIIIIFMISLGVSMRKSGLIANYILCPIYISIGTALFTSSLIYYKQLFTNLV